MVEYVQANGIKLACRFDGPEDGPILVLCNGLMTTYRMWDAQMTAFTATYKVLRYDMRGRLPNIEQTLEFNAAILYFLQGAPQESSTSKDA